MKKYFLLTLLFVLYHANIAAAASINITKIEDFAIKNAKKVGNSYVHYPVAQGKRYDMDYNVDAGTQIILQAKLSDGTYGMIENQGKTFFCMIVANAIHLKPVLSGKRSIYVFDKYRSLKTRERLPVQTLEFYTRTSDSKLTLIKSVTFGYDKLIEKKPSK